MKFHIGKCDKYLDSNLFSSICKTNMAFTRKKVGYCVLKSSERLSKSELYLPRN